MINVNKQKIGIYRQPKTTNHWNSPGSTSNMYKMLLCEVGLYPEVEFKGDNANLISTNKVIADKYRFYVSPFTGLPTLSFNALATIDTLHYYLAASCQSVTQATVSPFTKTFKLAGNSGLVNFANNEGHLFTIAGKVESSGDAFLITNALLSELALSLDFDAEGYGRMLKLSGNWVGLKIDAGLTISDNNFITTSFDVNNFINNTIDPTNLMRFEGTIGDYDIDFSNLKVKKFELRINNNISVPYRTGIGYAGNYNLTQEVSFSLQFILDSNTKDILRRIIGLYSGGVIPNGNLILKNNYSENVYKYFYIELKNILLDTNPIGSENNLFVGTLQGKILGSSLSNEEPLLIKLSDNQNIGY